MLDFHCRKKAIREMWSQSSHREQEVNVIPLNCKLNSYQISMWIRVTDLFLSICGSIFPLDLVMKRNIELREFFSDMGNRDSSVDATTAVISRKLRDLLR